MRISSGSSLSRQVSNRRTCFPARLAFVASFTFAVGFSNAAIGSQLGPDHERCIVSSSSASRANCNIPSSSSTISCEWQTDPATPWCSTSTGVQADCIVRSYPYRDLLDVFCRIPVTYPSGPATDTDAGKHVVITDDQFGGPRSVTNIKRYARSSANSGSGTGAAASSAGSEDCDAYMKSPYGSWGWMQDEKLRQRCFDRKAGVSSSNQGQSARAPTPTGEDCDSYVKSAYGSWDRTIEEKLRQKCLDRRAGVSTSSSTGVCVTTGNVTVCK